MGLFGDPFLVPWSPDVASFVVKGGSIDVRASA